MARTWVLDQSLTEKCFPADRDDDAKKVGASKLNPLAVPFIPFPLNHQPAIDQQPDVQTPPEKTNQSVVAFQDASHVKRSLEKVLQFSGTGKEFGSVYTHCSSWKAFSSPENRWQANERIHYKSIQPGRSSKLAPSHKDCKRCQQLAGLKVDEELISILRRECKGLSAPAASMDTGGFSGHFSEVNRPAEFKAPVIAKQSRLIPRSVMLNADQPLSPRSEINIFHKEPMEPRPSRSSSSCAPKYLPTLFRWSPNSMLEFTDEPSAQVSLQRGNSWSSDLLSSRGDDAQELSEPREDPPHALALSPPRSATHRRLQRNVVNRTYEWSQQSDRPLPIAPRGPFCPQPRLANRCVGVAEDFSCWNSYAISQYC